MVSRRVPEQELDEAKAILAAEVRRLRTHTYVELLRLEKAETREVAGPSGRRFQLEIEAFWDDSREKTNLRVFVSVFPWWGPGIIQPKELMDDFIVAPDGTFVGE